MPPNLSLPPEEVRSLVAKYLGPDALPARRPRQRERVEYLRTGYVLADEQRLTEEQLGANEELIIALKMRGVSPLVIGVAFLVSRTCITDRLIKCGVKLRQYRRRQLAPVSS